MKQRQEEEEGEEHEDEQYEKEETIEETIMVTWDISHNHMDDEDEYFKEVHATQHFCNTRSRGIPFTIDTPLDSTPNKRTTSSNKSTSLTNNYLYSSNWGYRNNDLAKYLNKMRANVSLFKLLKFPWKKENLT